MYTASTAIKKGSVTIDAEEGKDISNYTTTKLETDNVEIDEEKDDDDGDDDDLAVSVECEPKDFKRAKSHEHMRTHASNRSGFYERRHAATHETETGEVDYSVFEDEEEWEARLEYLKEINAKKREKMRDFPNHLKDMIEHKKKILLLRQINVMRKRDEEHGQLVMEEENEEKIFEDRLREKSEKMRERREERESLKDIFAQRVAKKNAQNRTQASFHLKDMSQVKSTVFSDIKNNHRQITAPSFSINEKFLKRSQSMHSENLTSRRVTSESLIPPSEASRFLPKRESQAVTGNSNLKIHNSNQNPLKIRENWSKIVEAAEKGTFLRVPGIGLHKTPMYKLLKARDEEDRAQREALERKLKNEREESQKQEANASQELEDLKRLYDTMRQHTCYEPEMSKTKVNTRLRDLLGHRLESAVLEAKGVWGENFLEGNIASTAGPDEETSPPQIAIFSGLEKPFEEIFEENRNIYSARRENRDHVYTRAHLRIKLK